jgi:hypothetical protein
MVVALAVVVASRMLLLHDVEGSVRARARPNVAGTEEARERF